MSNTFHFRQGTCHSTPGYTHQSVEVEEDAEGYDEGNDIVDQPAAEPDIGSLTPVDIASIFR